MNKYLALAFPLLLYGCQMFTKNIAYPEKSTKFTSVVAKVSTDMAPLGTLKIKSKMRLYKDSIIMTFHPFLGIEAGRAVFKNNTIYIYNHYSHQADSLKLSGPKISIKRATKVLFSQQPRDSIMFTGEGFNCVFKNYLQTKSSKNKKPLFVPHTISIHQKKSSPSLNESIVNLQIDYETIKLFDNK
ncbi:DUF4292 domain-containing protein [Flavobacteriales bacterium]|nr:DUF4292 domain-containing protein [Flavobacteriales bacterium]